MLALHACDTATDDALGRALEWEAPLVLAAPCCHHDIAAQLRTTDVPEPYAMLTRHGILRERFADTLTDALRAALLRREGYRVDVVEFVESAHTPAQHAAAGGAHGGRRLRRRSRVRRPARRLGREAPARRAARPVTGRRPGADPAEDQPVKSAEAFTSVCHRP